MLIQAGFSLKKDSLLKIVVWGMPNFEKNLILFKKVLEDCKIVL